MKSLFLPLLFFMALFGSFSAIHAADPPNIIVILADDLGYSDLGCYGSEIHTPNLDELASEGLRFTRFYNAARCWPTRSSIMSGYYPQQVNLDGKMDAYPVWGHLVPHHLKQAGYRNYHSGKWHVSSVKEIVKDAGFDHSYYTVADNNHFNAREHFLDDELLPPTRPEDKYYSTTTITDYAIKFLNEHDKKHSKDPFFLYLAYITPHFPLMAPEEDIQKYRGKYDEGWEVLKKQRYQRQKALGFDLGDNSPFEYMVTAPWSWPEKMLKDSIEGELRLAKPWDQLSPKEKELHSEKMAIHAAMVDRIDQEVGRVIEQLGVMGEDENTLVLFLSDNGASAEQIIRGEGHDKNVPPGAEGSYLCLGPGFSQACNTPFRRHKHWTHEGGAATPLIAWWPGGINDKGGFRHSMTHIVDFLPTFLELAGAEAIMERNGMKAPELPGRSLLSVFEEDAGIHNELYFSHAGNKALQTEKWKAVISEKIDGRWQLYDMENDRTELNNLADDFYLRNNDWKEEMKARLDSMVKRFEELDELYQEQGKVGLPDKK